MKYQNFLSRRKYAFICKTQSSVFDPNSDLWVPRNIKCLGADLRVPCIIISDKKVDNFVRSLDIGHVNQIPNSPGVSRTITGLVFMIIDLHLRLPNLCRKLIWFNENTNHFIFQFSDDGAPESSQLTMSIGSLTSWNFGDRVRSRDFQYILHCVSLREKDEVLEIIWKQHTDEMEVLEGNVCNVCGKQCTLEFQPSADMSWQSWANNELNQAATFPSPYANVSKGNMCIMGATIGLGEEDLFKPYTMEIRNSHVKKVTNFMNSLPCSMSEKNQHARKLQFMAENGIRQLGPPRIGHFADRQRPEPVHCEINAWQHLLNIIYREAVQRGIFTKFIDILSSSAVLQSTDQRAVAEKPRVFVSHDDGAGERSTQIDMIND